MGSFTPCIYYGFYCLFYPKVIYLASEIVLGISSIILALWDKFATPGFRVVRAGETLLTFGGAYCTRVFRTKFSWLSITLIDMFWLSFWIHSHDHVIFVRFSLLLIWIYGKKILGWPKSLITFYWSMIWPYYFFPFRSFLGTGLFGGCPRVSHVDHLRCTARVTTGGGGLAHCDGTVLHHRCNPLRSTSSRTLLPRKVQYFGKCGDHVLLLYANFLMIPNNRCKQFSTLSRYWHTIWFCMCYFENSKIQF